jgi:hypothetical protein
VHEVIQIVPYLPPSISGVGDYAFLLAGELRRAHDIHTSFVVANPDWNGPSELEGFPIFKVASRTSSSLAQALQKASLSPVSSPLSNQPVLLHYVGYGYQKRGCPFWLVRAMETGGSPAPARLTTMFHELYATGPVWRSSFWTSPLQRHLVARLANVSNSCLTNMKRFAQFLSRAATAHRNRVRTIPVFSNVGEMSEPASHPSKKRQLVVFGSATARAEIYSRHLLNLNRLCEKIEAERVVDIGQSFDGHAALRVPVLEMGPLCAKDVGKHLSESLVGIVNYPAAFLAKSGILAAYCAHGLCSVLVGEGCSEDGLGQGQEYLGISRIANISRELIDSIGEAGWRWYGEHSIAATATHYAEVLKAETSGGTSKSDYVASIC